MIARGKCDETEDPSLSGGKRMNAEALMVFIFHQFKEAHANNDLNECSVVQ